MQTTNTKNIVYKEKLKALGLFGLEKRGVRKDASRIFKYRYGHYKKGGDTLFSTFIQVITSRYFRY